MRLSPLAPQSRRVAGVVLISLLLALTACASATGNVSTGTPTATTARVAAPTATPAGPPPHAFAWTQHESSGLAQVWASVNGATPVQITHSPAPGLGPCETIITYGPPIFSPDLAHVVAIEATAGCGDGPLYGQIAIINVASATGTVMPGATANPRANMRSVGWVDSNTLFYLWGGGLYTYALGAAGPTQLPGVTNAEEAVVRGHTLFYLRSDTAGTVVTLTLHRYDLSTNTDMPNPIAMGQFSMCRCSPGDYALPGWDVSRDGAHVVFQRTTARTDQNFGAGSSLIMNANTDGTQVTQIAEALTTTTLLRMQLSPNGRLVAFDGVIQTAPVVTASTTSSGGAGDPNYHTYSPDAAGFPVWKWDNSSFWAASQPDDTFNPPYNGSLGYYTVGSASATVGVAGGY
ncbi:MAG TPA: hypothetical protein VGR57_12740, partial [Ktedonobacterales bacterium]|nr:hypothetical protein [Ktedonobacterales bacterium]